MKYNQEEVAEIFEIVFNVTIQHKNAEGIEICEKKYPPSSPHLKKS